MKRAFASILIIVRSEKPRDCGLTMIIDYGMGLRQQEDLLPVAGSYVDLAKIRVGSGALYESGLLRSKIDLYKRTNDAALGARGRCERRTVPTDHERPAQEPPIPAPRHAAHAARRTTLTPAHR